jgi:D-arginine dehydrogenase
VIADVAIVGGGIAGASVAWELTRRGARAVLLEAEGAPGMHSTGRSAAVLTETTGPPVVRALAAASRSFLVQPPDGFTDVALTRPRGVLWIATPAQRRLLEERIGRWRSDGADVEALDVEAALGLVPRLRPGYVAAAALEPAGLDLDVDAILQGFLRGARRAGTTVLTGSRVTAIAQQRGRWRVTATGGTTVHAPVLVNAAGAWADTIAVMAGVGPVDLVPMRRTAFVFPPPPGDDIASWPLVMAADESFYVKPDAGLLLASPCDESPSDPCDARADELDVALGVDRVHAAFDLEVRGVRRAWAGLRTFAADRAPVAGVDPDHPGFVWLAGQGGYGIKTAPALGAVAAAAALGEAPPPPLAGWLPTLSPGRFRTRAGSARPGPTPTRS